jgi:hypothetical protein
MHGLNRTSFRGPQGVTFEALMMNESKPVSTRVELGMPEQ